MGSKSANRKRPRTSSKSPSPSRRNFGPHQATTAPPRDPLPIALFQRLSHLFGEFMFSVSMDGVIRNAVSADDGFPSRFLGQPATAFLARRHFNALRALCKQVLSSGHRQSAEYQVEHSGQVRSFQLLIVPLTRRGRPAKVVTLIARDITERKQSQKNEALLLQAEEFARMGSFELDLRTGITLWSKQLYRNLHVDPETAITHEMFLNMVHPDDRDQLVRDINHGITQKQFIDSEFRCILSNGDIRTLHRRGVPTYDEQGQPVSIVGMSQDVTDRKRVEDDLRNREALLAQAEELANMGSWELNLETSEATYWSDQRYRLLGLDPASRPPKLDEFWNLLHPDDRDAVTRKFQGAIAEIRPFEYEARFILPDGRVRVIHSRSLPILDSTGRVTRLRGMAQDVTERRHEEQRLRDSEALLAHAEEIANVGSWERNIATGHTTLSQHLLRLYGLSSPQDWDLESYWQRVQLPDVQAIRDQINVAICECRVFEFTAPYRMPDGTVRIYHTVGKPIAGKNGSAEKVLGVVHDITAHTRIEESVRKLSQQLVRARDDERRQLARGLHETAGQTLAALKMTLGNLAEFLPADNTAAHDELKAARGFAEDAVREVRLVSYLMYPPLLDDAGLAPAISWYVRGFSQRSGIQASVDLPDDLARYSQDTETALFSVIQEALTNVHRYSGSATVGVRLTRDSESISAEIEDQGCGLPIMTPVNGHASGAGVGIAGMRERVKQLGGSFEILSTPGRGTLVRAILPVTLRQDLSLVSVSGNGST